MAVLHAYRRNCNVDRGWFETHVYNFRVHIVNLNKWGMISSTQNTLVLHLMSVNMSYSTVYFNKITYSVYACDRTTTTSSEWDRSISPLAPPRLWCLRWWVAQTMMWFSNITSKPVMHPMMVHCNESDAPPETRCRFCSILLIFLCFSFV